MKKFGMATAVMAGVLFLAASSHADSITDLQQQVDELKGKIQALQPQKKIESSSEKSDYLKGLCGNTLDPHRVVLNVTSQLADWINFNSELEWEHGGSDGGPDGSISVEQAYL